MTVGFPWVLWSTGLVVLGVVAAHLLSVTRPPPLLLPTARFVPDHTVRAVSRATRPTDPWLLLLRVLAILLLGFALSAVRFEGASLPVGTLLVVDAPPLAADSASWRALVRNVAATVAADASGNAAATLDDVRGEAVRVDAPLLAIVAHNGVHAVDADSDWPSVVDSLPAEHESGTLASLLLRARRSASSLATSPDSVQLIVVSSLLADVDEAALDAVRAGWPGRITLVPFVATESLVPAETVDADEVTGTVEVASEADDIVQAAFALGTYPLIVGASRGGSASMPVRVLRRAVTAEDTSFAESGGVLVLWDSVGFSAPANRAVIANGIALVAPLGERALPETDALPVVWWADGRAAVNETVLGAGCVRFVGFAPPPGDLLLGPDARGVLSALAAPCGNRGVVGAPPLLSSSHLEVLVGSGALADREALRVAGAGDDLAITPVSPLTRPLLLAALLVLLFEAYWRRRIVVSSSRHPRAPDALATESAA